VYLSARTLIDYTFAFYFNVGAEEPLYWLVYQYVDMTGRRSPRRLFFGHRYKQRPCSGGNQKEQRIGIHRQSTGTAGRDSGTDTEGETRWRSTAMGLRFRGSPLQGQRTSVKQGLKASNKSSSRQTTRVKGAAADKLRNDFHPVGRRSVVLRGEVAGGRDRD